MRRVALLLLFLTTACRVQGQGAQANEQLAKAAVLRIIRYTGLQPDIVVRANPEVRTAIAFIRQRKRVVEYNPTAFTSIMDSSRTDWSAISILAHEVGHHLLGHTLEPGRLNPGDELACDFFSGFTLNAMGATLDESLAAMRATGDTLDTDRHPQKLARLEAIRQGWMDRERITRGEALVELPAMASFHWSISFEGDPNTYYVNDANEVVWFNELAQPIPLGAFAASTEKAYQYTITMNAEQMQADGRGVIWKRSVHGMLTPIGHLTHND